MKRLFILRKDGSMRVVRLHPTFTGGIEALAHDLDSRKDKKSGRELNIKHVETA